MALPSGQKILVLLTLLLATWLPATPAGGVPEMVTDRPDRTESPVVVPPGYVQVEAGWDHAQFDENGVELTGDAFPSTLVRIGLARLVELRVGLDGYVRQDLSPGGSVDGVGDSSLGVKVRLAAEKRSEAAVIAQLGLTTGDSEVSALQNDPSLLFTFANAINDRLSLGYNLGVVWETVEDGTGDEDTLSDLQWTVALGIAGKGSWGYFVELFGTAGLSASGPPANSFDCGVTYLLKPNLQFDVAAGVGLSSAAPDWFTTLGISYRFPR
jgi:hypothetical protein